jgi:protein-S-isoprenylcysteine O-methyltransferase Ste14
MKDRPRTLVLVATGVLILLIISGTILLGYALYWGLTYFLGHQPSISLPLAVRLLGMILLVAGFTVLLDVLRYRRPLDILVSTSETFTKMITRKPLAVKTVRTEPFIPKGPYVYVRNPMYFGVVTIPFGLGLFLSSTPLLLWGLVVTCWFWFYEIPFEEKELQALFGDTYTDYRRQVPKLFPYGKKYRPHDAPATLARTSVGKQN